MITLAWVLAGIGFLCSAGIVLSCVMLSSQISQEEERECSGK